MRNSHFSRYFIVFLALLACFDWVVAGRDFYKILGVSRDASATEIKKAYRKLALQYHPDKNTDDPDAEQKFVEISNAYDVLIDPDKRAKYDQFGESAFDPNAGGGGRPHFQRGDAFNIFEQFFKGFGGADGGFPGGSFSGGGFPGGSFSGSFPGGQPARPPMSDPFSKVKDATILNANNFQEKTKNRDDIWLLLFYQTNQQSAGFANEFNQVISQLKNYIKIGVVNSDKDNSLAKKHGVDSYPKLVMLPYRNHDNYDTHSGALKAKDVVDFVFNRIPSFVTGVRHSTIDRFLSQTGKPKVLLITSKAKTPPMFNFLAKEMREKYEFGLASKSDAVLLEKYGITEVPKVLLFRDETSEPITIDGQLDYDKLKSKINQLLGSQKTPQAPKYSVTELTAKSRKQACPEDTTFCAIFVLENAAEVAGVPIADFSQTFKKFRFSWVNSTTNSGFLEALGKKDIKRGLVIYNPKKRKYVWSEEKSLEKSRKFFDDVTAGVIWSSVDKDALESLK